MCVCVCVCVCVCGTAHHKVRTHQVALEANEVHPHGQRLVGVSVQGFDALQQVSAELEAPLQHTQHYNVMVAQVVHDVPR